MENKIKAALVTGGSRGIGKAVCIKMASMGYHVVINYRSNIEEAKNTASSGKMWQNVERSVIADNCNHYRKELSASEIFLFEGVAGETLEKLGYKTDFIWNKNVIFSNAEIKIFDKLNELFKQKAKQQQLPGDAEKRMLQEALLSNIRKRLINALPPVDIIEKIAV